MDLLAQLPDGTAIAATGWASFGLAGLILYWLAFHHLPSKDKQISELLDKSDVRFEKKDKQVGEMLTTYITTSDRERNDFRLALDRVITHCETESSECRSEALRLTEQLVRRIIQEELKK